MTVVGEAEPEELDGVEEQGDPELVSRFRGIDQSSALRVQQLGQGDPIANDRANLLVDGCNRPIDVSRSNARADHESGSGFASRLLNT